MESDIQTLIRLAEQLPSQQSIARLSESDVQDNVPLYILEVEDAIQGLRTGYASEIGKQVVIAVRDAAEVGDIRQGVGKAFALVHEARFELSRLETICGTKN
ncbi:hypothetical protein HGG71_09550 [Rhodobacteraceae bacterium R_SAG2]|nr:hypothetical protein [Rhodobacteraceae bacterium R_SAG2]